MSKSVSILEGQKGRKFSGVKYIRTGLQGGGTCEWVPEDERKLTTKRIAKNGTYLASDEKDSNKKPYYGFSQVTIAIKNGTTGKKNPSTGGDGNEYSVTADEDGRLKETPLPSSIVITTPPDKTEYKDGETILMSGAVVKAYKADGTLWEATGYAGGVIPLEELTIEPNTAQGGDESHEIDSRDMVITDDRVNRRFWDKPITVRGDFNYYLSTGQYCEFDYLGGSGVIFGGYFLNDTKHAQFIMASKNPFVATRTIYPNDYPKSPKYINPPPAQARETRLNGETFYAWTWALNGFMGVGDGYRHVYDETDGPMELRYDEVGSTYGYIMLFGDSTYTDQEITVKWTRPEDMKTLETLFTINVT